MHGGRIHQTSPQDYLVGSASMSGDGALTITFAPAPANPHPPPLVMQQGEHPEVYAAYVDMAGGLQPGESKPLYSYAALVRMNADRSLTVAWPGHNVPGELIVEPYQETILPDPSRYDDFINRVGGLNPGETKGLRR